MALSLSCSLPLGWESKGLTGYVLFSQKLGKGESQKIEHDIIDVNMIRFQFYIFQDHIASFMYANEPLELKVMRTSNIDNATFTITNMARYIRTFYLFYFSINRYALS